MPIIAQAAKKLRRDRRRTIVNKTARTLVERLVKTARKTPTAKNIAAAFRQLDKAVKRKILHANTAARTKSRLAKRLKK